MGSVQAPLEMRSSALTETSCGYLLQELRMIWDEVGEDELERERTLLDLEQECLEVYRRKVDNANMSRVRLHQELAEAEAGFTHLLLSLGERSLPTRPEKMAGTLKEQLNSITPALREMQLRKEDRVNQFRAVQGQIQKISAEIAGQSIYNDSASNVSVNENDLSLKKLEDYKIELQRLQNEKQERLRKVEQYISEVHKISAIMGMESSLLITKVHPSLNELCGISKNISDDIIAKLSSMAKSLDEEKKNRLDKLHHLGKALTNLWNLMDTPYEDRQMFYNITKLLSVSAADICRPGSLTVHIIEKAEAEVQRLDESKASKMKELFLKKQVDLEEIYSKTHMENPSRTEMENILDLINSGVIDHADLLKHMDDLIFKAKEEASSRKAIMEKVVKWMQSRDEERWLEEYNMDENRYRVRRGAHKNLQRAEHARVLVNKMPGLVESLIASTKCWEERRGKVFLYDEVPLLAMLEEYRLSRQEMEGEKHWQKEKKKVQGQIVNQQENTFASRPNTGSQHLPNKSINESATNSTLLNRRLSFVSQQIGSKIVCLSTPDTSLYKERKSLRRISTRPYFSPHLEDETASVVSTFSGPLSP
ncbi:unnamed protein product [Rhodiola kirilowii]